MTPRWMEWLVRKLAPRDRVEDVLGDLEEVRHRHQARRGRLLGTLLAGVETLELVLKLLLHRRRPSSRTTQRTWGGIGISVLDLKLGLRMLSRYPGLTLVGRAGDGVRNRGRRSRVRGDHDADATVASIRRRRPRRLGAQLGYGGERSGAGAAHDFVDWRAQLRTVEELGAYRTVERNLITAAGPSGPVAIAEISASAFPLTGARPVMGRTLSEADERPGVPPVVVIGEAEWRTRFRGDPLVLGQEVRLGAEVHTIVGVMPEAYGFPIAHRYWVPLRLNVREYPRGDGPAIAVFGRLAPGSNSRRRRRS